MFLRVCVCVCVCERCSRTAGPGGVVSAKEVGLTSLGILGSPYRFCLGFPGRPFKAVLVCFIPVRVTFTWITLNIFGRHTCSTVAMQIFFFLFVFPC